MASFWRGEEMAEELPEMLGGYDDDRGEYDDGADEWNEDELPEMLTGEYCDGRGWGGEDGGGGWDGEEDGEDLSEVIFTAEEIGYENDAGLQDLRLNLPYAGAPSRVVGQQLGGGNHESESDEYQGDVDAVRVVLLGMSDTGRPSVEIDLGLACTGQYVDEDVYTRCETQSQAPTLHRGSQQSSLRSSSSIFPPSAMQQSTPNRHRADTFEFGANNSTNNNNNHNNSSTNSSTNGVLSPSRLSSASSSPFIFRPPPTPNHKRTFVFSEHAAHNKQTFLFEGSTPGGATPSKFCSSFGMKAAIADSAFVYQVVCSLPGVDPNDARLLRFLAANQSNASSNATVAPSTPTTTTLNSSTSSTNINLKSPNEFSLSASPLGASRPSSATRDTIVKPTLRPSSASGTRSMMSPLPKPLSSLSTAPATSIPTATTDNKGLCDGMEDRPSPSPSSAASTPFKPQLSLERVRTPREKSNETNVNESTGSNGHCNNGVPSSVVRPPSAHRMASARAMSVNA